MFISLYNSGSVMFTHQFVKSSKVDYDLVKWFAKIIFE